MRVKKKIFITAFCFTMLSVFNNIVIQAAANTTSTWDLVRRSLQEQSQPASETTADVRTEESLNEQKQTVEEQLTSETEIITIKGQVVDYMARPVEGAEVAVIERKVEYFYDESLFSAKVIAPVVKTDENGLFEVQANTTSKTYISIVAGKAGLAYAWDDYQMHCLLVLEKASILTGKVVDHNGKAVPGAKVQAVPKTSFLYRLRNTPVLEPKEWFTTETDSNGNFSFDSFNDNVSCVFYVKTPDLNCTYIFRNISASNGFEVWRDDIELVLPQEGEIQGRVVETETNRPVGPVELLLQPDENRDDSLSYLPFTIITNTDGSFVCDGLAEGQNTIEIARQDSQEADWFAETVKFNVSSNQLNENIEIKVQKGGIIEYLVQQDDTKQPLSGIYVATIKDNFATKSITNQQGIIRERVQTGRYRVLAERDFYPYPQEREAQVLREGDITRFNIELPKSPLISGTVVDADGKPAKNILVTVYPVGETVYTDGEGRFEAWRHERVADKDLYIIARDIERSLAAFIHTDNLSQPVKLSLSPALTVKGKIADPDGLGIPAARISLISGFTSGLTSFRCIISEELLTDAEGLFEFKAIPILQPEYVFKICVNSAGFAPINDDKINIQGEPGTIVDVGTINLSPANLTISGTLFDANGLPKPHTFVGINKIPNGPYQSQKSSQTDEQGRFVFKGVAEGLLKIQGDYANAPGGAGSTTAQGGDQDIKVIIGQKLIHMADSFLLGEPLPSIDQFGLSLNRELTENRKILLCFADIDQRPSRNTILRLNEQAQELLDRDLYIVFIQAVPVEEQKLVTWCRDNEILPPVGMSKTGILELGSSYSWGVQALPWLILTDAEHNVTAEGFSINELDEKISNR